MELSPAFRWLRELTDLSKRSEAESIEPPMKLERSGVPGAAVSEAV